ncbi:MAG: hypothetical protein MJ180_03620 [Candidatus Gastranaerophilales bacterium]|nr:hypothetical protein [Candidatus Gastranaerophilales bacterium]
MFKRISLLSLFAFFIFCFHVSASELRLQEGKTYILTFDEEILNYNTDEKNLYAEILHTIFDDKTQMIISLKNNQDTILQVKTENNYYNYNVKPSDFSSKNLIEIDYPSMENLDVDIYTGEKD